VELPRKRTWALSKCLVKNKGEGRLEFSFLSALSPLTKGMKGAVMFISMSTLADYETAGNRSYGNELFQYAALKIYAEKFHLSIEIPERWVGREMFEGCNDPPLSQKPRQQKDFGTDKECFWLNGEFFANYNIKGYFQYHTSVYAQHAEYFKKLFTPKQYLRDAGDEFLKTLKSPLIGIHIRRGDYGRPPNRIAPNEWYLKWLQENWDDLDNPTLFIASDEINAALLEFGKYSPFNYWHEEEGMRMFVDHYVMQHCDILLASNSTFSFTAAMLNEVGDISGLERGEDNGKFYRPDYQEKKLVSFDPWNSDPLTPFPHHMKSAVRLHLGCGVQRLPGYVNIDCKKTKATDLICDIRRLPHKDNSVDTIESYHVFEHFPVCLHANIDSVWGDKYASLITILKEWRRVLKRGGNLAIEMPDLDGVIKEYLAADEKRKEELLIAIYGSYRNDDNMDTHQWGANEERLRYIFKQAGFRDIKFCEATDYHIDICPCLRVEAVK